MKRTQNRTEIINTLLEQIIHYKKEFEPNSWKYMGDEVTIELKINREEIDKEELKKIPINKQKMTYETDRY